ncbi:MAG: addiction module protein [Cyanobium sp.]
MLRGSQVGGRRCIGHGRPLDWISPKIEPVSALSIGLMAMNLPLSRMSLQEKLVAMELLWADLSATPDQVVSPAWHGEELQRRREQVQQGSAKFLNWDDAIAELKIERH